MKANHPLFKETPSYKIHKRQLTWQILMPMFLIILAMGVACIFITTGRIGQARLLADISVIWLLAPLMIFGLLLFVLLVGLIFALAQALKLIPGYSIRAQQLFYRLKRGIKRAADLSVAPLFWVKSAAAALSRLTRFY
jgi:hypothetical protein